MVKYEVTPTTCAHVAELSLTISPVDRAEIWAAGHVTPWGAITMGYRGSRDTKTFLADDQVMCIYGVGVPQPLVQHGVPWMLSTGKLWQHGVHFARGSAAWMTEAKALYTELVNYVDARNTRARRWLSWLGFTIEEAKPYGPDNALFHRFVWRS
jgi:hypothetical protein